MTKTEVLNHYKGRIKELSQQLGVWPQTIYAWPEHPPLRRQYQIQEFSQGMLRVSMPESK